MKILQALATSLLLAALIPVHATTLLGNADIHTMDRWHPHATAMAWNEDGELLAVGASADLKAQYPDARYIDAHGHTVIPGLIDAHGHMLSLGQSLMVADLTGTQSKQAVVARLQAFAKANPGEGWLIGRGWDQNDWQESTFPTAAILDEAFPERPVFLERVDGHAAWVNSAAMAKASRELDGDWQPEGGHIVRHDGQATGVLVDGAAGLVAAAIPPMTRAQKRKAYQRAMAKVVSVGLTGVGDAGVDLENFRLLQDMAADGEIPLRLYAFAGDDKALDWLCQQGGAWSDPTGHLQMRTVKLFMDGALGSRGAALLKDYSDDPGNRGLLVTTPGDYLARVKQAHRCGIQVATHAIGDRANRHVLDVYAKVLGSEASTRDHRWRIEHAQIIASEDIPRFARLNVIASMQPTHATSDMDWADERLGQQRLEGAYAWQRLRHAGVVLALGSDFPVEDPNPMLGLYAAITRQDRHGQPPGGWFPDQRLTRHQALAGFTINAAYAQFMEDEVGILKPGMLADFVILDADPMTVPAQQIDDIKPLSTWVGGQVVYRAGAQDD